MKTLLSLLLTCGLAVAQVLPSARAIATPTPASGGGVGPDIDEGFEGTGDPDGAGSVWTTTGTVDWDSATQVLSGSQSAAMDSTSADIRFFVAFTATDEVWIKFGYYADHIPSTDALGFQFRNSTTELARAKHRSTGIWRVLATAGTQGDTTLSTGEDSWRYFWLHYKRGTGADCTIELWWATTDTFPGSGNAQYYAACTDGTGMSQCDNVAIWSENIGTVNGIRYCDDFQLWTSDPGW